MRARFVRRWSLLVGVTLAVAACSSSSSSPDPSSSFTVRIRNASATPLTAVHVATGPNDEIVESTIAAGQTTTERAVSSIHSAVAINARVYGQAVALIPVEGFAGFNPELPPGRYEIAITVRAGSVPTEAALDVSIAKIGQ